MPYDNDEIKDMIRNLQTQVKELSDKVLTLAVLEQERREAWNNQSDALADLKAEVSFAKGSLALIRGVGLSIIGFGLVSCISFSTWIVTSYQAAQLKSAQQEQAIALLKAEMKIVRNQQMIDDEKSN